MSPRRKNPSTTGKNDEAAEQERADHPTLIEQLIQAREESKLYAYVTDQHVGTLLCGGLFSEGHDVMLRMAADLAGALTDYATRKAALLKFLESASPDGSEHDEMGAHYILSKADLAEAAFALGLRVGQALAPHALAALRPTNRGAK